MQVHPQRGRGLQPLDSDSTLLTAETPISIPAPRSLKLGVTLLEDWVPRPESGLGPSASAPATRRASKQMAPTVCFKHRQSWPQQLSPRQMVTGSMMDTCLWLGQSEICSSVFLDRNQEEAARRRQVWGCRSPLFPPQGDSLISRTTAAPRPPDLRLHPTRLHGQRSPAAGSADWGGSQPWPG